MTLWERLLDRATSTGTRTTAALLTFMLLALKLTHNIDWSWWHVFGPLLGWIAMVLVLAVMENLTLGAPRLFGRRKRRW